MLVKEELTQAEIDRILHSQTFRNSEVLRVLLRFLGEKTITGETDHLKEYTIGIDALGKPPTYDPRQDSSVRIQVGRLRQKLGEYYRNEGKDNPFVIDVPKGQFKVTCEPAMPRVELTAQPHLDVARPEETPASVPAATPAFPWRWLAVALGVVLAVALAWGIYAGIELSSARRLSTERSGWTPELNELWKPFLATDRPLIMTVATPLFVGFEGAGVFRDTSINTWEEVQKSAKIEGIREALNNPAIGPRHYVAVGEIAAVFRLGKILAASRLNVAMSRSDQISQQQLADSNVIFVGAPRVFGDRLHGLPAQREFVMDEAGVNNVHPRPGEPARMENNYPRTYAIGNVPDSGEIYAVITHEPGPLGSGDILSFSANHSPGTLAAVQWFTEPSLAKILTSKLRKPNGEIPRYYQVVLRVNYKDTVPIEVTYVMHRELGSGIR